VRKARGTKEGGSERTTAATNPPTHARKPLRFGRRRALAILETLGEILAAATFESIGRPKNNDYPIHGPASLLASFFPRKTSPDKLEEATQCLERGEALLKSGDASGAVEELTRALELAPWQYKLAQKALLRRSQAYDELGNDFISKRGEDFRQEWLWGRGVRWPGWYILSYIFFRKAFVDPEDESASNQNQSEPNFDGRVGDKSDEEKNKIPIEWFLVIVLVVLYNFCLFNYGLEY